MSLDEFRLVVKRVDLAAGAGAEDHQDLFCSRRMMRTPGSEGLSRIDDRPNRSATSAAAGAEEFVLVKQVRQSNAAESERGVAEKMASIEERIHGVTE